MDWIRKLLKYMYLLVMFLIRIFAIHIRPFFLHNKKSSFLPNLIFSVLKTSQKLKEFLHFFLSSFIQWYETFPKTWRHFRSRPISYESEFPQQPKTIQCSSLPLWPALTVFIVPYWKCFFLKMLLISLAWNESEKSF